MNIHLLRSPELKEETYRNVLQLLQQFRGPLHFLECEAENLTFDTKTNNTVWKTQKEFETTNEVFFEMLESNSKYNKIEFPFLEKTKTWEQLFEDCDNFRKVKNLSENDIVVLLTDIGNDKNWFGSVSPSMKNYFIHTSNWEHFFGNSIDIRFPIAYEVIIWVMRYFMFSSREDILENVHKKAIGCIMDFCQEKSQIILKMRTADVCNECMLHFKNKDIPKLYTRQFFEILDGIRESLTFRKRAVIFQQPSEMVLKGYTKKIFFSDLGNLELRLNPKEKALYLFYLNHPEGVNLNELQDHKVELTKLYACFCNQSNPESINSAIELMVNPTENNVFEILARINKKLKDAVGESLLDFYCIKGERGEIKQIKLDREFVKVIN